MKNSDKDDELRLLSFSAAAKRMKIGRENLYDLIKHGKIGTIQIGKRSKIAVREILRFIDENTVRYKELPISNYPPVKSQYYKSADEIFYDIYQQHTGKIHRGKIRKMRAAERAEKLKNNKSDIK